MKKKNQTSGVNVVVTFVTCPCLALLNWRSLQIKMTKRVVNLLFYYSSLFFFSVHTLIVEIDV